MGYLLKQQATSKTPKPIRLNLCYSIQNLLLLFILVYCDV